MDDGLGWALYVHPFISITQLIQPTHHNPKQVVPTLTRSKAWECTLAAHSHDFATIAIVTKDTAEDYCMKLQKGGLTISVAPDSNFKKDGEEGGGPQFNGGGKK